MKTIIALLFVGCAFGQVRVAFTPESLRSNVLGVNQVGEWDIGIVNLGPAVATKSLTELLMAAPAIHRVPTVRSSQVLNFDVSKSKAQRMIRVASYVDIVAPAIFPGLIALTAKGVASVALGTAVVHHFTDNLKAIQPDQNAYTSDACPDMITLAPYGQPGYSLTCSIFSSLVHNAATIGPVDIGVNGALPARGMIDQGISPCDYPGVCPPHADLDIFGINAVASDNWASNWTTLLADEALSDRDTAVLLGAQIAMSVR